MFRLTCSVMIAGIFVGPCDAVAQSDPRVNWLRSHAIAVRSIDPADQDFRDLADLRNVLAGARIVLLGEASHGDGATFLAKTRLVEFLHRELGFDALIFESGFYDCWKAADSLKVDADVRTSFQRCVWPMWSARQELNALVNYASDSQARGAPLDILGLDPDFIAAPSREQLGRDLRGALSGIGVEFVGPVAEFLGVIDNLNSYLDRTVSLPGPESVQRFVSTAQSLAQAMDSSSALAPAERGYWARILENLASHARSRLRPPGQPLSRESVELRDGQMARNLAWLIRVRLPGRRVIVWSASLHAARNLSALTVLQDPPTPWGVTLQELYHTKRVMGDYLRDEFGDSAYAIGFTALEGRTAGGGLGTPLQKPSKGSLEDLLGSAGFRYALLDLRRPINGGAWRSTELTARPLGHSEMRGNWSAVLDGVFFLRTMTPSTPTERR